MLAAGLAAALPLAAGLAAPLAAPLAAGLALAAPLAAGLALACVLAAGLALAGAALAAGLALAAALLGAAGALLGLAEPPHAPSSIVRTRGSVSQKERYRNVVLSFMVSAAYHDICARFARKLSGSWPGLDLRLTE